MPLTAASGTENSSELTKLPRGSRIAQLVERDPLGEAASLAADKVITCWCYRPQPSGRCVLVE